MSMTQEDKNTLRKYIDLVSSDVWAKTVAKEGVLPKAIEYLSDVELKFFSDFEVSDAYKSLFAYYVIYRHLMLEYINRLSEEKWREKSSIMSQVSGIHLVLQLPNMSRVELEKRNKLKINKNGRRKG